MKSDRARFLIQDPVNPNIRNLGKANRLVRTCSSSRRRRMSTAACRYCATFRWSPHSLNPCESMQHFQQVTTLKQKDIESRYCLQLANAVSPWSVFNTLISLRHPITSCSNAPCLVFSASSIRSSCLARLSGKMEMAWEVKKGSNWPGPKSSPVLIRLEVGPWQANCNCSTAKKQLRNHLFMPSKVDVMTALPCCI